MTPDGRRVVSASEDNTLKVWDLGGTLVATFTCDAGALCCTFAGDLKIVCRLLATLRTDVVITGSDLVITVHARPGTCFHAHPSCLGSTNSAQAPVRT